MDRKPPQSVGQGAFDFEPDASIQQKFEAFHRENPRVYELLVKFSRQVKATGREHYSINAVFERIRWHVFIETKADDQFKLNNIYRSRYARMLMEKEPDLRDFFDTRELKRA